MQTNSFGGTLHLTNFSFEFFYEIFTEDASLLLLYHGRKKVKNDQKLKSKGLQICQPQVSAVWKKARKVISRKR